MMEKTVPIKGDISLEGRCMFYIDTDRGGLCDGTWSPCLGYGYDKECEKEMGRELDEKVKLMDNRAGAIKHGS